MGSTNLRRTTATAAALLVALACSEAREEAPRVVSLTPQGTRAIAALGLSHLLVAVDAASRNHLAQPLPTATLEDAVAHRPDLLLVAASGGESERALEAALAHGTRLIEVAPHDFSDAFALYREIARALGDESRALAVAHRLGDPLARRSTGNLGRRRPRVAPILSLDPLVLAGGHSFVSDLVETAGAESITHGDETAEVRTPPLDRIRAAAPELILVAAQAPPSPHEESVLQSWFAPTRIAFVPIAADEIWLAGADEAAEAVQRAVDEVRSRPDR